MSDQPIDSLLRGFRDLIRVEHLDADAKLLLIDHTSLMAISGETEKACEWVRDAIQSRPT